MNAELSAWEKLRAYSMRQLSADFAAGVIAHARVRRIRLRTERRLVIATFVLCVSLTLGWDWRRGNTQQIQNWEAWSQFIQETQHLEESL
ncbi:MAG: hypothetical protein HY360_22570 [Verrucomicrobia bacterium]|nr:hypothetical protein [Verrucomicrobiota bacterium]